MPGESPQRALHLEPLESRSLPSSILLAFASMEDEVFAAVERSAELGPPPHNLPLPSSVAAPWRFHHSNPELLQFVEEHTTAPHEDLASEQRPTESQCRAADEMMKLKDSHLRALVVMDLLTALRLRT
jgi:hypothetical protein